MMTADNQGPLRVVCCWTTISGYMAACWRALAARPEVELHVLAYHAGDGSNTAFSDAIMRGISARLLAGTECDDVALAEEHVVGLRPDVVVMTGWWRQPYRRLPYAARLAQCGFMMGMDTPWRTPLQYVNRVRVGRFLRRLDRVVVAGARAGLHARKIGVPPAHILHGQYGVDVSALRPIAVERAGCPWPRSFLFVGRYVDEKAIDVLVDAYALYRTLTPDPWNLVCCGSGPLVSLLQNREGIRDVGFVQPEDLASYWRDAGAFVIPSRFDPWPLALVEAAASGLPIIASDACGSADEVVEHGRSGLVVRKGDRRALAHAMLELQRRIDEVPDWSRRATELAAPYAAEIWAEKWSGWLHEVAAEKSDRFRARPGG